MARADSVTPISHAQDWHGSVCDHLHRSPLPFRLSQRATLWDTCHARRRPSPPPREGGLPQWITLAVRASGFYEWILVSSDRKPALNQSPVGDVKADAKSSLGSRDLCSGTGKAICTGPEPTCMKSLSEVAAAVKRPALAEVEPHNKAIHVPNRTVAGCPCICCCKRQPHALSSSDMFLERG